MTLRAIAIGPAGQGRRLQARSLRIELALGALMRGELRATEMKLVAPQLNIGLDSAGQSTGRRCAGKRYAVDRSPAHRGWPSDPDRCREQVELVLDQLWFTGDVRSLTGPIRGKGEFVNGGGLYGYEISVARAGPDGTRVKLSLKTESVL